MENQYDKVFTIKEASKYFKIPSSTLYRYIKKGKIPCFKEGKQWKLKSSTLIQWLRKKNKKTDWTVETSRFLAAFNRRSTCKTLLRQINYELIEEDNIVLVREKSEGNIFNCVNNIFAIIIADYNPQYLRKNKMIRDSHLPFKENGFQEF